MKELQTWTKVISTPISRRMFEEAPTVYKANIMFLQGSVALLGDACHPSLPYQGQGSAMAAEDGLCLGTLLGRLNTLRQQLQTIDTEDNDRSNGFTYRPRDPPPITVPDVLALYESLRKRRTTFNIQGALDNRSLYHLADPLTCAERNEWLKSLTWEKPKHEYKFDTVPGAQNDRERNGVGWLWGDMKYQTGLLGWDTHTEAVREFRRRFERV